MLAHESEVILKAEGLCKRYRGRAVVDGVSLEVRRGEIVGLLGPNGAGKTTTFYMILGLIRPDGGRITFESQNVTRWPVDRRARLGLGYLAQEPSVFRKLTARENVLAVLQLLPISEAERQVRLQQLLEDLGIAKVAVQKAYTLSGGERRKVEIARALAREPSLLMLDEPFSGVDPLAVQDLQGIIRSLRDAGMGLLITDHNVRETLSVVDRAYLIHDGRVLREGSRDFLVHDEVSRRMYLGTSFQL